MAGGEQRKLFSLFQVKSTAAPPSTALAPPSTAAPLPLTSSSAASAASPSAPASSTADVRAASHAFLPPQALQNGHEAAAESSNHEMAQPGQLEGQQATATAQGNSLSIPLQASSSSSATASTSKRRVATTPSLSLSIDDDDDDDIVIVSSSSSTRPGQPQLRKKSRQVKASTSRGSTRSSTPVITIPDSPPPKKPSSSFAPLSQLYRAGRERRKANEPVEARWPTQEEHGSVVSVAPQARDLQRWKSSVDVVDSGKGKGKMREDDTSADIFQRLTASIAFNSAEAVPPSTLNHTPQLHYQQLSTVGSLLPSYTSHPLLDRIADPFRGPSPSRNNFLRPHDRVNNRASNDEWRDIWTAKYAPKAANEVLGSSSGRSAGHLKDWLSELAIWSSSGEPAGKQKRRRAITRGADLARKKKKRGGNASNLEDFIASDDDDDDLEEGTSDEGSASDDSDGPSYRPAGGRPSAQRSVFRSLTNLILLVGPHGSGKTSSVHAAAKELDWSVFEVWPGIGKRGAKDVERYVGDVGKNHMVRSGGGPGSPKKAAGGVFDMFRKPSEAKQAVEQTSGPDATQSLILFDEVDVLYREEKDFWSGLIALAKQSRRPIILTCTDISGVPFEDLGLQRVDEGDDSLPFLQFDAPALDAAVTFLQLVALAEGHIVSPAALASLYSSTINSAPSTFFTDGPAHPLPFPHLSVAPAADLRRALSQLQFQCQWGVGDKTGGVEWMDLSPEKEERTAWSSGTFEPFEPQAGASQSALAQKLDDSIRTATGSPSAIPGALYAIADSLSFADAYISRRNEVLLEDHEPTASPCAGDEQLGAIILGAPLKHDRHLPQYGHEDEMAETLFEYASLDLLAAPERVELDQATCMSNAFTMVAERGLVEMPAPILPHPAIFVDYLPYLRLITEADDAHAAVFDEQHDGSDSSARRGRRSLRLAGGAKYARALEWTSEEARLIRQSGFDDE